MDAYKTIEMLQYIKTFDEHNSGATKIAIDNAIEAIQFNLIAEELLSACAELLNRQNKSVTTLNLLNEIIVENDCSYDGECLLGDINDLLECIKQTTNNELY